MTYANAPESTLKISSADRRLVASYDVGYEHSQQHYIEMQCIVEDGDEEISFAHLPPSTQDVAA